MKRLLIALMLVFTLSGNAEAAEISVPARVSQGHAFPAAVTDSAPFEAVFVWRGESFRVQAECEGDGLWKAEMLLAMPLDARGKSSLTLTVNGEAQSVAVTAVSVPWPESILKVAPKYVEPPRKVQEQIARDARRSREALAVRTKKLWTLPLLKPVPGGVTSPFGGRRVFNGKPRAPHKGTDMRSPEGAKVLAVADGTVLLAEAQYFGGNTVYIDHGQGVVSTYAHLSAFDVTPGQRVRRGQVIGRSGSTGRVTGPHLHLGLLVQGTAVDVMPLFADPPQLVGGPTRSIFDNKQPAGKNRSAR
ncbi:M23 family metallopeptidase [uncultured Mailhella sp.]|uniref:M23 family metallopeptidase n=1 Tax=uncultured Mailhella sp. TaxID=1981031 RepID=UPI0025D99770|nr:M23 family metallopeptidase [uncultured Mailhella sp.]